MGNTFVENLTPNSEQIKVQLLEYTTPKPKLEKVFDPHQDVDI